MAIIKNEYSRPKIDLSGPAGNAYVLLGTAEGLGKQLGMDKDKVEEITKEMKAGNYDHLITVFDEHFGEFVDLVLPEGYELNPKRSSPPISKRKSQP